jgi:hypothetical protein
MGLTSLALRGCDAVRGTRTCGGGPGLLLLLAVLVAMLLSGAAVLALLRVAEPRATSLLGVGALGVLLLLIPTPGPLSGWLLAVVPPLGAVCFLLAHLVATAAVERRPEKGPEVDVR